MQILKHIIYLIILTTTPFSNVFGKENKKEQTVCNVNVKGLNASIQQLKIIATEATDPVVHEYLLDIIQVVDNLPKLLDKKSNQILATCGTIPALIMALDELQTINSNDNPSDILIHNGCFIVSWTDQIYVSLYQKQIKNSCRRKFSLTKEKCKNELVQLNENIKTLKSMLVDLNETGKKIIFITITQLENLSLYIKKNDLTQIVCKTLRFINYAVQINLVDFIDDNLADPDLNSELNHYSEHIASVIPSLFNLTTEQRMIE